MAARLTSALSGGEEVIGVHLLLELVQEALLPDHAEYVSKCNAAVVDGVEVV